MFLLPPCSQPPPARWAGQLRRMPWAPTPQVERSQGTRSCQQAARPGPRVRWLGEGGAGGQGNSFSLALSSHLNLQGVAEGGKGRVGFLRREEPQPPLPPRCRGPWPPTHRSWSRSCVSFSRASVPDAHLPSAGGALSTAPGWGLDSMVVTAQRVLMERWPGRSSWGARKGAWPCAVPGAREPRLPIPVPRPSPWSPAHSP